MQRTVRWVLLIGDFYLTLHNLILLPVAGRTMSVYLINQMDWSNTPFALGSLESFMKFVV